MTQWKWILLGLLLVVVIPIAAMMSAATKLITTTLRWVLKLAVVIDLFIAMLRVSLFNR